MKLATLVSLVPSGGTASSVRNALDGNAGSAFRSLLSRMAEDGSAAATPAAGSGAAATGAADVIVSGDDSKGNAKSQQAAATAAAAEDGPELSEAAAVAGLGTAGGTKVANGAGVTSLLTLAKRAAKSSKTDDSDQGEEIAPTPVTVAALVATTSALAAATAPSGSDASDGSSTIAGGATLAREAAIASSAAASDAVASAPLPSDAATAVESAIVPETVAVESHLGFSRGVPGALPGTAGASPSRSASTQASSEPEGAASSDASLALEDDGGAADAAASGTAAVGEVSANSVAHVVPSSSKPTADESTRLALDAAAQVSATPVVAPNAEAATPVLQQVADSIIGLASAAVPDESGFAKRVAPARTMALQLSPAGLGTLTIRLHVAGRALDVQLETSDGNTAALIDRDRDALSVALSGKDYQLQSLSVTTHDATMPGANYAERSPDTGYADPGSSGQSSGNNSSGGRAGDQDTREAPLPTRAEDAVVERNGGSSLFV